MSNLWVAVLALVTSLIVGGVIMKIAWTRQRHVQQDPLLHEVHERSHEVTNGVTDVRAGLQHLSEKPDPLRSLVHAMRGHRSRHGEKHGDKHGGLH